MNTYLCIGGPLHGKHRALQGGCNTMAVPVYSQKFIGVEELYDDVSGIRETRYNLTTITRQEKQTATGDDGSRATISVTLAVDVLVHESILTVEETNAYYQKLKKNASASQAVSRALSALKL